MHEMEIVIVKYQLVPNFESYISNVDCCIAANEIFSLPMYPYLNDEEVLSVYEILKSILDE